MTKPIDKKSKRAVSFTSSSGYKPDQDHALNNGYYRESIPEKSIPRSTIRMDPIWRCHSTQPPLAGLSSGKLKQKEGEFTEEFPDENSEDSDSSISSGYRRAADIKRTVFESDPKKDVLRTLSGHRGPSYMDRVPVRVKIEK